jgi:Uma2 family endonuclease
MSVTTPVTAEQLLKMPDDGQRYELVAGQVRKMAPAGWEHGIVGGRLHGLLTHHVLKCELGEVFLAETGFVLARNPDTVRAPDIAFIEKHRVAAAPREEAFWPGAPDLAVEVVSPSDTVNEVDEKVKAWLDAGTRLVWVVNPKGRNVTVYRSSTDLEILTENNELSGENIVPGFRCRIGEIFRSL